MTSHATTCDYHLNETAEIKTFTITKGGGAHCWLRRLSHYHSCSCSDFRLRAGCGRDLFFCFVSWRVAYSSAESLVRRICARLASTHRSGKYFSPNTCSSFSLAAASCPGRMACRASYSSTGSRSAACDFASAYSCSVDSRSAESLLVCQLSCNLFDCYSGYSLY